MEENQFGDRKLVEQATMLTHWEQKGGRSAQWAPPPIGSRIYTMYTQALNYG